ncbi:ESAT-6 protein secretion system EspG family protein [Tamaricihabitans halophyticus]|uniref:ESAT-6 protein secretion system EspG family protein n=1 Tax=Tamaricihabitans halophyticus TaxID=1262583 RepID=A0A4R2RBM9_9PSEU|nr:ESX secretion-associated protein EspG [Tamaricihabitans halophyticus]TCP56825.1 ESAT-6 protein secretion system EspG family protein [Tamaricihabitans halophyticus]
MTSVFSLAKAAAEPVLSLGVPPTLDIPEQQAPESHIQVSLRAAMPGTQPVYARAVAGQQHADVLVPGQRAAYRGGRADMMTAMLGLLPERAPGTADFTMIHADRRGEMPAGEYAAELATVWETIERPRIGTAMIGLSVSGRAAFDHERPSLLVLDNDDGRYVLGLLANQHGGTTLLHHPANNEVIATWVTNAIGDYEARP